MTLPSIVASISKVLILGIGCHLLIPGTAYAQPFDPQEIDRFLRSAPLDVYVSGEGEPGSPVSTMEFLGDGVLLVAGLASHVDALYWTMMPIEDSIYLTMGFDDEPEPHPVDYLLVVGFEGESLVLEADPSHYDAFTITLSRGPTAHPAATHPEALVGAWIVESIDGVPLDVTLGYVLDGDGGFAELGGHEEARRHLPTSAWRDEHAFADLSSIEETRYDVRATLRTDVEAAEAVVEFLAARLAGIGLEPVRIASLGDGRIEAKLRAVASSGLVADALRPRGRLEFRLMPDPRDVRDARWNVLDALDEEDRVLFRDWPYGNVESVVFSMVHQRDTARVGEILLRPEIADLVPSGMRLMWYARDVSVESDEPATYQLAVRSGAPAMTHEVIIESRVERDAFTQLPMVSLTMSDEGAATWADLTERNVGRQVAMIVDDIVYSFPRIIDRITGGRTQITGLSPEEAERLAVLLTPGELPAPVEIVEIQTSKSQAGLEVIQPGFESYGIPVGWQLSRSRWRVPVANADKPVADGPVLVLLYEGEIPTTFIVTELSGDEMILHGAGSNMEQTTLILRRGPAGQQAP